MAGDPAALPANLQPALTSAKRMARGLDEIRAVDFGYVYKDGKPTDETGIRFHMNRKRRIADLPADQRLPNTIEGVQVDVLEVGYTPHQGGPRSPHDPLQPGISVGTKKRLWTGTLGPIVRDLNAGQLCLLSNWHVLCGGADAAPGDEITQPGPMDMMGGRTVALLERWLRLNEQYDAALARLTPGAHATLQLFGTQYAPTVTKAPALGMRLMKSGAVSGITQARVDGVGGSYRLDYTGYGDGPQWMEGFRLVPDPDAPAGAISLAGDSGSLWIDGADAHAVGLHFAGEDDASPLNDYALAHPIEDVFARLNVALMPLEEAAAALASMAAASSRPARKRAAKKRATPPRAARAARVAARPSR